MTENDREAGRWQGMVDSTLEDHARRIGNSERNDDDQKKVNGKHDGRLNRLETKQQIMWSALASVAALAGGLAFKIWTGS